MQASNQLTNDLFARCSALIPAGRLDEAIPLLRQLLEFFPGNPIIRGNLADALAATGGKAVLSDFTRDVTAAELGTHLFLACMPKSGSSFLTNCLLRLTGFAQAHLAFAYMQGEQEIYLPNLVREARGNTVTQQHCRATEANLQMMEAFGIRPIVLVRNLADVVVSLLDFYDAGAVTTSFLAEDYAQFDRHDRIDALIDIHLPWYVQFHASWDRARRQGRIEMLRLGYEEMIADKPAALARIGRFLGFGWTVEAIARVLLDVEKDRSRNRFNQGRPGRAADILSASQKQRIARFARPFPSVDFSVVGL